MGRWAGCLAVVCLVAVGCSSSDESATPSTSTSTSIQAPPSSESTTTTTEETTTTADQVAQAEAAAAQAVLDNAEAWRTCVADVPSCDVTQALSPTTNGKSLEALVEVFQVWKDNGWEARPPLDPDHGREEIVTVEVEPDGSSATVTFCTIDGGLLVDPGAAPDGSDVIINDQITSFLSESSVVLDADGAWRVYNNEVIAEFEGGDGCGDLAT